MNLITIDQSLFKTVMFNLENITKKDDNKD